MRRLGAVALACLATLAGAIVWTWLAYRAPGPLAAAKIAVIPKNARLSAIAGLLAEDGIVAHGWVFAAGAVASGAAKNLKAGEYEFASGMSAAQAAALIAAGRVVQHRFTLPEGLTSAEAQALIAAAPALDGAIETAPPEGALLPDTYFYPLGTRRSELVARMERARTRALDAAWAHRAPGLPLASPEEALILASIVEKETAVPEERARVAGVYLARLRIGMRLQADPTVLYAVTKGGREPLGRALDHADLAIESPYNTYLDKGLPPTPIDNPGAAAVAAAMAPEDRGELYFVADGSGRHAFAKTLDEHNRNVRELRRRVGAE